jgi:hypothetical protein
MWQASQAGRPAVVVRAGVAVIAVTLLAGCTGSRTSAEPPGHPASPALTVASGPPGGSRAQALALAGRMLASLVLPADSHVTNVRPPGQLRQQPGQLVAVSQVEEHRLFSLGLSTWPAIHFLRTHTPPGMRSVSPGQVGSSTAFAQIVSYSLKSLPPGIYQAQVDLGVVEAAGGRSLMRADAQVIWYQPRTATEHIDPARYAAVILKARVMLPKSRNVTRRITSKGVIARLAAMLNGMHAAPNFLPVPCPLGPAIYQAGFAATARSTPSVLVVADNCLSMLQVTTGGHGQPALLDSGGRFEATVQRLLGLQHLP